VLRWGVTNLFRQLEISLEGLEIWRAARVGSPGAHNGAWQSLDTETGAFAGW
jgi:hypothetical protein